MGTKLPPTISKEMVHDWLRLRALAIAPDLAKLKEEYIRLHIADISDPSGRMARLRWKLPTAEPVLQLRAALLTQPRIDLRAYAGSKPPFTAA